MKKIITLVFVVYAGLSNAQTWCPPGAEWVYALFLNGPDLGYQRITYEKDTVINAHSCKKLNGYNVIDRYDFVYPGELVFKGEFIDTINPIFTYNQGDTVFVLADQEFKPLYYFNAQVGDTLETVNGLGCSYPLLHIVDSTGSLVVGADTLRYYVARNLLLDFEWGGWPGTITVVERIGAVNNHFVPMVACMTDQGIHSFRCYNDDSFELYNININVACDSIYKRAIGIDEIHGKGLSIFPNPTSSVVSIYNPNRVEIRQVTVYDVTGREVLRQENTGNATTLTLDVSELSGGSYFLQTRLNSGEIQAFRLVRE